VSNITEFQIEICKLKDSGANAFQSIHIIRIDEFGGVGF